MKTNPRHTDLVDRVTGQPRGFYYSTNMHPNPRFYKYYWRIFHLGSVEGPAFFDTPRLSTFQAMALIDQLNDKGEGFLVYNWSRPRTGDELPFDFNSNKWRNALTAPSYDEDPDTPWRGHK